MRHPIFQRHLIGLIIGAQLAIYTGVAVSAAASDNEWPVASQPTAAATQRPPASTQWPGAAPMPAFGPLTVRPNFQAPSATSCSSGIRTRQLPERQAAPGFGLWPRDVWPRSEVRGRDARAAGVVSPAVASAKAMNEVASANSSSDALAAAPAPLQQAERRAQQTAANPMVTAGVVDDNANFAEYLAYRQRTQVAHRPLDIAERYLLQVRDATGRSVPDAEVRVQSPGGRAMWARTDAGGQVWLSPDAFDASRASTYQVSVRKPGRWGMTQATAFLQRGQKSAVDVTLDAVTPQRAQLDLVFLIDATGSMGDEIDKLKTTLRTIAAEVAKLPAQPDLCFGLVAYRDKGDQFELRSHDLTRDLGAFQGVLNQLRAGGGGDYPEAMNEALHDTVHNLSWRGNNTTRMVFLLADAPPHLDYGGPQYDDDMQAALGKGIKVFSVGASGLEAQGEYIQRQIAQYTGGKFVFLTYAQANNPASGPGRETVHDVQNYSVDSLDRLIVRLVREDLARLGKG
ncbi:MAG: carboxypeptidase regulatory-like domain-containing protein [Rhodoferax sp.]|uniref:vWA domain-containing protein n=1 Tax=Rhodoferax sp. TaxID=50421 RepID=UPI001B6F5270|nr:carboxypeptidase regulatory-like domain-containing protein [Rhodoferax sp.]MBP9904034.1 carboxypeptidase regulatory-like domain-containing protein [Rhodoferax sp.]